MIINVDSKTLDQGGSFIDSQIEEAHVKFGAEIRNDSARPSPARSVYQRAMIRKFVEDKATLASRLGTRGDVSEERQKSLMAVIAQGLGLSMNDGEFKMRGDSLFFAGEGIDGSYETVRQANMPRGVSALLPVRNCDPTARLVRVRTIERNGSATIWKSGQTQVPHSSYDAGSSLKQVHHLVTKTSIPWDAVLYGTLSDLDVVGESAWSARETLLDAREQIMVNGFTGTDLQGLVNIAIPKFTSLLDYSNGSVTIEDAYEDIIAWAMKIKAANYNRGGLGNAVLIAPSFAARLLPLNNLAAGGDADGISMFSAMAQTEMAVGRIFRSLGITTVVEAPALDSFGGDATMGAMLFFRTPAGPGGLRQLIGMDPAPVRSASTLTHDEALWATALGGLEANVNESAGLLVAKVN